MQRKVILSKTAQLKLEHLLNYLIENWSVKVKKEFVVKLEQSLNIIKEQPEIFPKSNEANNLRKCVLSKQTILFYRFTPTQVNVLTIFDSRQDPQNLIEEI